MPLLVKPTTTPELPPAPRPPIERPGTANITWTDPDGVVWPLSGPSSLHGWFVRPQIAGWGSAPVTIVSDPLAGGGVQVRHIRSEPRRITVPLNIHGEDATGFPTHMRFLDRYRSVMRAFTMTTHRGIPGVLRVARPSGTAREIDAFYEDGFGGEPGENWLFANPAVTLFCPDGYWRDVDSRLVRREHESTGVPYLNPYLTVSSSQVLGETEIVNPGEVTGWPVWTITGPASALTATNHTLGVAFTLTYALAVDETITITTGPARPTVRGPSGENLVGALDWPDANLWPLAPGVNSVDFSVAGSNTGTAIELLYYPRYEAS